MGERNWRNWIDDSGDCEVNRRAVLASLGTTALAGCPSSDNREASPGGTQAPQQQSNDNDCVDQEEYEELYNAYQDLQNEYERLRSEYEYAVQPPYVVAEGRQFNITVESINGDILSYQIGSDPFETQINRGTFMRNLTLEQLQYLGLHSLANRFENNTKYRRMENYGSFYQYSPFVTSSIFTQLSDDFYSKHNSDDQRLREAWNFVTSINTYTREIGETPRLPLETLLTAGGDCEDSSILLASILVQMSSNWTVDFVYMDADNPQNPREINHVAIGIDTGSQSRVIETTTNNEMSPFDRVRGFFVEVNRH